MSAEVVPINGHQIDERHRERAREMHRDVYAAYDDLCSVMRGAGLDVSGKSPAFSLLSAGLAFKDLYERRSKRVERGLREVLANDLVTERQREQIEAVLSGKARRTIDKRQLADDEWTLVRWYRRADSHGRHVLRTICARMTPELVCTEER